MNNKQWTIDQVTALTYCVKPSILKKCSIEHMEIPHRYVFQNCSCLGASGSLSLKPILHSLISP